VPSIKLALCVDKSTERDDYLFDWIASASTEEPSVDIDLLNDIGFQGVTGGTTGLPKLTLSSYMLFTKCANAFRKHMHVEGGGRNLVVAPITHAGGMLMQGMLAAGATNYMIQTPEPNAILDLLEQQEITTLFLPPTLVYVLLKIPRIERRDFSSMRYLLTAGAPMAANKIEEATKVFGNVMCQGLGQTEVGFPVTFIGPAETSEAISDSSKRERLSSCGKSCEVLDDLAIMDEAGNLLPVGEQGEIVMKGDTVIKNYLNDEVATLEVQRYGWHHTGDVGFLGKV